MFEFCQKIIQFNTISQKNYSNNYLIQYISHIFNSKNYPNKKNWVVDSIQKEIQFSKWGSTAIG